jgi:hypothetical protein
MTDQGWKARRQASCASCSAIEPPTERAGNPILAGALTRLAEWRRVACA